MAELTFFDCHAEYGARPGKAPQERWSLDHLLADLELAGVAGALVRHTQARYDEPDYSNRRLLEEIAPHRERLWPCWTVVPPVLDDFPAPAELVRRMVAADVRAVTLYPKTHGLPVHAACLGELAEALAAATVPVFVSFAELGDFATADTFLALFAGSPVVLTEAYWSQWRLVQLLMDRHPHLHLTFHNLQANRAVETFGERYGFTRCLFGSGLPMQSAGAARALIDYGLYGRDAAQQVAAGNLTRLLKGAGPTAPPAPGPWHDGITAEARAGTPLSCRLLDAHCHVLRDGANYAGEAYVMPRGDASGLLEVARRLGTDATALMSWNGTVGMDAPAGNQVTAAAVAQAPDELLGLLTLNPTHQSAEEMQAAIAHYHLGLGFPGLKPYQRTPLPYNHPSFEPWWQFGHDHALYALFHISVGGVGVVLDIAQRFPNLHCLIAHSGGSFAFAEQVVGVAKQAANISAELTLTPVTNGVIEYLCAEIGADRVLYGTDAPMRDPRPQLGWVVYTRLSEADKRLVLGENFRRILLAGRLPGARLPASVSQPLATHPPTAVQ